MTRCPLLIVAPLFFLSTQSAFAYSSGPPIGKAGEPGGSDCTDCHTGVVNSGPGILSLSTPPAYQAGMTYEIAVTLEETDAARWGFELVVLDSADQPVGEIVVTDGDNTQLMDEYVMQTSAGTYAGTESGPVDWYFDWIAPATDVGLVSFYVAGNAANNNGGTSGDHIYTEFVDLEHVVGVQSMSWSMLKRAR